MKNIFKLAAFCSISLLLFSCRPEKTIEDDPIENQSTINQQKMEYNLPYLSQSFTLSGTFFNGSQNFNIEIIFQNSPTKSLYKYFEYVDENGNSIGQQDLDIYFEDDSGKAKAYIVDNKNNAKITNVYNSSTQEEIEFDTYFANPFIGLTKDSFTYQNNGAYFEEGYAMGLGKPVIQLCKKDVRLHFDVAQKNTIIWETEEEIVDRLKNRIKATID